MSERNKKKNTGANNKFEDRKERKLEPVDNLESFESFVKATGWKAKTRSNKGNNTKGTNIKSNSAKGSNTKGYNSKEGSAKDRNTKGYNSKEGSAKGSNTKGYNSKEGNTKDSNTKGYNSKESSAKDRNTKGYNSKESSTKDSFLIGRNSKESSAKDSYIKGRNPKESSVKDSYIKGRNPKEGGARDNYIKGRNPKDSSAKDNYIKGRNPKESSAKENYIKGRNPKESSVKDHDLEVSNWKERNAKIGYDKDSKRQGNYVKSNKSSSNYIDNYEKGNDKNGRVGIDHRGTKEENRSYDRRRPEEVTTKGACKYTRDCGGCNIMRQSYQTHLAEKQSTVDKLLKKYCKVEPIIGMEQPNHYRHKVHVVFDHDRKGNPISGVYEEGTHRVIAVDQCLIHNEKADAIIATIRGMLKSFKILTYDEDTGYGLLRHVMIRTGYHSGEIMVVLVLGSPILPSKNNFVKVLLKEHPEITTVVVNVNDKKTSMVLGDKEQVIYGKGYIEDTLCGKTFRISPKSFYQVNPVQTEVLYNKAIEFAGLSGNETVIDAYCGIGTIGLIAAEHAGQVIGVEFNKDAVKDAIINAKLNNTMNIEFFRNDAGVFMSQMAEKKDKVDVVFMDPPRNGSNEQFMDAIGVLKPNKVVYVSCNPVTLERDLQYLMKKGYKAEKAVPVDMFPWTGHVETCVLLSHKNS